MLLHTPIWCPVVLILGLGCSAAERTRTDPGGEGGEGGSDVSTGGGGGSSTGGKTGGADAGTGGATGTGGSEGTGGSAGGGAGMDAGSTTDLGSTPVGDAAANPPTAGQGPVADGKIVFSQDFEQGMTGVTRSPNGLPV